jgi:ABC-type Fe3+-siderophore transport system permease subunit
MLLGSLGFAAIVALAVVGTLAVISDYPAGLIAVSAAAAFVGSLAASLTLWWLVRRRSDQHP